jgi:hypothetical protein
MSAPSLAGANHAQPQGCFRAHFIKGCSGTLKNMLSLTQIASKAIRNSSPDDLGSRLDLPHLKHGGFGATQVRTQNCMNLCEVGLVIVNWVFLGKTSRKGIGSTDLTLS